MMPDIDDVVSATFVCPKPVSHQPRPQYLGSYCFFFLCVSVVKSQTVSDGIDAVNRGDYQPPAPPWKDPPRLPSAPLSGPYGGATQIESALPADKITTICER
jgi:hypothetical protein